MPSQLWRQLERGVDNLRHCFLPPAFDALGTYANAQTVHARTRAFLVLGHAEVETYLESWAKEIARTAEVLWQKGRVTSATTYLFGTLMEKVELPRTLVSSAKDTPERFTDASKKAFVCFYETIKENNGIKEASLIKLFGPLGLPASVLSPTLVPNLDSLGRLRGQHAHESSKAVRSVLDPETEYNRVLALISDLKSLDTWLIAYRRRLR